MGLAQTTIKIPFQWLWDEEEAFQDNIDHNMIMIFISMATVNSLTTIEISIKTKRSKDSPKIRTLMMKVIGTD
jgi:hypothetical protein